MDDLIERLRQADRDSQQRCLGSRIFAEAADEIDRLRKVDDALGLLQGLHPCITCDPAKPMTVATLIFDSVQAQMKELNDDLEYGRKTTRDITRMFQDIKKERDELSLLTSDT